MKKLFIIYLIPLLIYGNTNVVYLYEHKPGLVYGSDFVMRFYWNDHVYKGYPSAYGSYYPTPGVWMNEPAKVSESQTVIVVEVTNIVLTAITDFWDQPSSTVLSATFWYKVDCVVKSVVKGDYPMASFSFATCRGGHPAKWPIYVSGFCFIFGMQNDNGVWRVENHVRTCSLPPYEKDDHRDQWDYFGPRAKFRENQELREKLNNILENAKSYGGRFGGPDDVSIEKNKYVVLSYPADFHMHNQFDKNFGKQANIVVYDFETEELLSKYIMGPISCNLSNYIEYTDALNKHVEDSEDDDYVINHYEDWIKNGKMFLEVNEVD